MSVHKITEYIRELPPDDGARATIVESWHRCLEARLARESTPAFRRLGDAELQSRLSRNAAFIAVAAPFLKALVQQLPGSTNVAYITDSHGIVLAAHGPEAQVLQFCLMPGFDWSEATMGTNGVGTCIATRRPVIVAGPEHYLTAFHDCTCTAAPVRDPGRRLIGALDVSSSVADARPDRIRRVIATVARIEEQLPAA